MTDDDQPTTPAQRSWTPETGWPSVPSASAPSAWAEQAQPTWAQDETIEQISDEPELEAWLEAQEPEPEPEPEDPFALDDSVDLDESDLDESDLDEPEPALEADQPAVPGGRSATVVLTLLVALVVALAGLTAFLAQRSVSTRGGGGVEDARQQGLQAARQAARLVFSYDYHHVDKDFAAGKAVTTGQFAEQYGATTPKLVEVAKRYQAVVVADVSDAAVISASEDKVTVLVFVNQQSTSTLASAPKITQSRVTMVLVRTGGRWLVSEVHAF